MRAAQPGAMISMVTLICPLPAWYWDIIKIFKITKKSEIVIDIGTAIQYYNIVHKKL